MIVVSKTLFAGFWFKKMMGMVSRRGQPGKLLEW